MTVTREAGRRTLALHRRCYATAGPPAKTDAQAAGLTGGWTRRPKEGDKRKPFHKDRIGFFRPMKPEKINNSSFLFDLKPSLDLPDFASNCKTPGAATQYGSLAESGPMRWFGTPRNLLLENRILSQPATVIRNISVETFDLLEKVKRYGWSSKGSRYVLTGPAGSGKSTLLLQTANYAHANNWIVFYFPRTSSLINNTLPYTYSPHTQTYHQHTHAYWTLRRFARANESVLKGLTTTKTVSLPAPKSVDKTGSGSRDVQIGRGVSILELINRGVRDMDTATIVLAKVMEEIGEQTRIPVLLAIDEFQALYSPTLYKDQHFSVIKSYHLSSPRTLLEYAGGVKEFKNGIVLGAVSPSVSQFPVPRELEDVLHLTGKIPSSPYDKKDKWLMEYAKGLKNLPLPDGMNAKEAASVFEVWMKDKALAVEGTDNTFLSAYTTSAGNPRAFVWGGLLSSLEGARAGWDGADQIKNPRNPEVPAGEVWPQLRLLD